MKKVVGAALAGTLLVISIPAYAVPIAWNLNDELLSGSFIYDADTNTYSGINLVADEATYMFLDPSGSPTSMLLPAATTLGTPTIGDYLLRVTFAEALTNAGGAVAYAVTGGAVWTDDGWKTLKKATKKAGEDEDAVGTPVAVPEPTALTLFAIGCIGLFLSRRRANTKQA